MTKKITTVIDYDTTHAHYEFSHGRKPRGRGIWAFEVHGARRGSVQILTIQGERTLASAVKEMKAQLRQRGGFFMVRVAP